MVFSVFCVFLANDSHAKYVLLISARNWCCSGEAKRRKTHSLLPLLKKHSSFFSFKLSWKLPATLTNEVRINVMNFSQTVLTCQLFIHLSDNLKFNSFFFFFVFNT